MTSLYNITGPVAVSDMPTEFSAVVVGNLGQLIEVTPVFPNTYLHFDGAQVNWDAGLAYQTAYIDPADAFVTADFNVLVATPTELFARRFGDQLEFTLRLLITTNAPPLLCQVLFDPTGVLGVNTFDQPKGCGTISGPQADPPSTTNIEAVAVFPPSAVPNGIRLIFNSQGLVGQRMTVTGTVRILS